MKEITFKPKDIKHHIVEHFGPLMTTEGYIYKKTDNQFICHRGNYTYIFNMLLTAWNLSYSLSIRLWISQKQIEDIYESIVGKSHGLTFGEEHIERIYYSPDGREIVKGDGLGIWLVNDEDVYNSTETLKTYYYKIAKPYFNKFTTLEAIDDFINNPPFEYSPAYVGAFLDDRCMKGLIAAKLVNNPNYKQLVGIYDELIKETESEESINNYRKVKSFLKEKSIN